MINFDVLDGDIRSLAQKFRGMRPFPHIVLDDFADTAKLNRALASIPSPGSTKINKSRDYIFAKNKFEKANFKELSAEFLELYEDFVSDRFSALLLGITGERVFVDKQFFGGGVHQGGEGSFLDMHADFNYHPLHNNWFRNLNILLYLNKDWLPDHGGQLKLRHATTGESVEVEPLFNRCVLMFTREYTLHGYDKITFPQGRFRRSIAAYAYSLHEHPTESYRSTRWQPESGSIFKKAIGSNWPKLVRVKNLLFGIGTKGNQ